MRLGDATWREVADASRPERAVDGVKSPIVLIPVGSTEQHGPHLPLATDTLIAEEFAGRAIHQTDGLMVGPTISVGASGEHAGFAGTLSIGLEAMTMVVVELVRSADWAAGVVLVNGHGGNHRGHHRRRGHADPGGSPRAGVVAEVATAQRRWAERPPCGTDRDVVDAGDRSRAGPLRVGRGRPRHDRSTNCGARGVRAVSPSGVLGDPDGASGGEGDRFISTFVDDLVHEIEKWRPIDPTPHR